MRNEAFKNLAFFITTNASYSEFGVYRAYYKNHRFAYFNGEYNKFGFIEEIVKSDISCFDYITNGYNNNITDSILLFFDEETKSLILVRRICGNSEITQRIINDICKSGIDCYSFKKMIDSKGASRIITLLCLNVADSPIYAAPSIAGTFIEVYFDDIGRMSEIERYMIKGIPDIVFKNTNGLSDDVYSLIHQIKYKLDLDKSAKNNSVKSIASIMTEV